MNPLLRLYGHGVCAGVSIGVATGAAIGLAVGVVGGSTVAGLLAGLVVGGLVALGPSFVGALVLVVMVGHGLNVARDVTITIGLLVGVLDVVALAVAPAAVGFIAVANAVMAPMLWWARRSLVRTAGRATVMA